MGKFEHSLPEPGSHTAKRVGHVPKVDMAILEDCLRLIVQFIPRCHKNGCGQPATHRYTVDDPIPRDDIRCELHARKGSQELSHAPALKRVLERLGGLVK